VRHILTPHKSCLGSETPPKFDKAPNFCVCVGQSQPRHISRKPPSLHTYLVASTHAIMSSRFFARGGDSDDSSSESEEELYDIDGEEEEKSEEESSEEEDSDDDDSDSDSSSDEEGATGVNRFLKKTGDSGGAGFLKGGDDSDESDEERTAVVRSAKDKRTEELEGLIRLTENAMKISDFIQVQNEFDKLLRVLPTVTKQLDGKTPKIFIKTLSDLEASVTEAYDKQKVTPKVNIPAFAINRLSIANAVTM
jgi:translation initiation factor 3 subunit C